MKDDIAKPCNPDHNGECIICGCWISNCAWDRFENKDFRLEKEEELLVIFRDFIKDEHKKNI